MSERCIFVCCSWNRNFYYAYRWKNHNKYKEIDGRLVEVKGPIKLNERDPEDRREIQDKIGGLIDTITATMSEEAFAE